MFGLSIAEWVGLIKLIVTGLNQVIGYVSDSEVRAAFTQLNEATDAIKKCEAAHNLADVIYRS